MKYTIELNEQDIRTLKKLRAHYGENDASIFEQNAYRTLNKIVKNLDLFNVSKVKRSETTVCPKCKGMDTQDCTYGSHYCNKCKFTWLGK